jgi:hypothetical protein
MMIHDSIIALHTIPSISTLFQKMKNKNNPKDFQASVDSNRVTNSFNNFKITVSFHETS